MAEIIVDDSVTEFVPHKDFNKVADILRQEWTNLARTHSIITYDQAMERFNSLDLKEIFDTHKQEHMAEDEDGFGLDQRTAESMALGSLISSVRSEMEKLEKQNRRTIYLS